jgi:hypothetical protein
MLNCKKKQSKLCEVAGLQYDKAPVRASVLKEAIIDTFCIILQSLHLSS